jgi:hypothetical protein
MATRSNMPIFLGLGALIAYYAFSGKSSAAPAATSSNVVTIVMTAPALLQGDEAMTALARQFGWMPAAPGFIYDATLTSPSPGQLVFTAAFNGNMPKLPKVGQQFTAAGVPVMVSAVSVAPARVI